MHDLRSRMWEHRSAWPGKQCIIPSSRSGSSEAVSPSKAMGISPASSAASGGRRLAAGLLTRFRPVGCIGMICEHAADDDTNIAGDRAAAAAGAGAAAAVVVLPRAGEKSRWHGPHEQPSGI